MPRGDKFREGVQCVVWLSVGLTGTLCRGKEVVGGGIVK
jgi:hypothetical protein